MKHNRKFIQVVFLSALLLALLAACGGSRVKFVAPEIDPPADLIPGYVPDGFKLISGFQIEKTDIDGRLFASDGDGRVLCNMDLADPFFDLKSPAGNDLLGVYYQDKDQLLLITKSYFPHGNLELWQTTYEASYAESCDCECDCLQIVIGVPIPFRAAEIQEVRTIAGTQVVILKNLGGWVTIFVHGEYLIAVESGIILDENLKIVESILQ